MTELTLETIKDIIRWHKDGAYPLHARDDLEEIIGWLVGQDEAAKATIEMLYEGRQACMEENAKLEAALKYIRDYDGTGEAEEDFAHVNNHAESALSKS